MSATTSLEPGLNITYSFREFSEPRRSLYSATQELIELKQWALGDLPPPDLLVLGYSSWMMQVAELKLKDSQNFPHDVLDLLLTMHEAVVPLLDQISRWSRVLVLSQSRLRPHSRMEPNLKGAYSPSNFDWGEMAFLEVLRHYRATRGSPRWPHTLAWPPYREEQQVDNTDQVTKTSNDPQRLYYPRNLTTTTPDNPYNHRDLTTMTQDDLHNPSDSTMTTLDHQKRPHNAKDLTTTTPDNPQSIPKDYLTPSDITPGLWWWDSSLPLNLAGILECEDLYRLNLTSHPIYTDLLLHCMDGHHPGTLTVNDMVTMLFNLMCNSVLGLDNGKYCCG
ncbi:hypothetical protein Hamer_G014165 [Homarus americanus]|uniref:Uncharacterized protein n=1 Tax=Homarus americanus TaxID=6706 RepID=A0A8J5MSD9_HOMAM|nr:hypothetical protein Hamer_G014165 [Homarus americanus]